MKETETALEGRVSGNECGEARTRTLAVAGSRDKERRPIRSSFGSRRALLHRGEAGGLWKRTISLFRTYSTRLCIEKWNSCDFLLTSVEEKVAASRTLVAKGRLKRQRKNGGLLHRRRCLVKRVGQRGGEVRDSRRGRLVRVCVCMTHTFATSSRALRPKNARKKGRNENLRVTRAGIQDGAQARSGPVVQEQPGGPG